MHITYNSPMPGRAPCSVTGLAGFCCCPELSPLLTCTRQPMVLPLQMFLPGISQERHCSVRPVVWPLLCTLCHGLSGIACLQSTYLQTPTQQTDALCYNNHLDIWAPCLVAVVSIIAVHVSVRLCFYLSLVL